MKEPLSTLRQKIDEVDNQLIRLLEQRFGYVQEVGELKKTDQNTLLYRPEREQEILLKIKNVIQNRDISVAIGSLYQELMSLSKKMEGGFPIGFLGPEGSYTHQAALKRFGKSLTLQPARSIDGVFELVQKGTCRYGIVPIENSTEGMVNATLDNLLRYNLSIYAEVTIDIEHCLVGHAESPENIERILTHPQAYAQCRNFLLQKLPHVDWVETSSTSAAAAKVAENKDSATAAIASRAAAQHYSLPVIKENIGDYSGNSTRFIVIGYDSSPPSALDRTLISFVLPDSPGALQVALEPFRKYNLNLTSIESRPAKQQKWSYVFFIDIDGHQSADSFQKCMAELKANASNIRILGSYPKDVE